MQRLSSLVLSGVTAYFGLGCGSKPAAPQSAPFSLPTSCDAAEYHRLDFWIGEWDVTNESGARDGTDVIARVEGGCAIEERWSEAAGGSGRSLFFFDRALGRWKQVWVTSAGIWKEKRERDGAPPGTIRFEGEVPRLEGGVAIDRTTLGLLDDGRVRQVIERSVDGGSTWTKWVGLHARKKPSPACSDAAHRAFDFWVGDWDVTVRAKGAEDAWVEARGTNDVRATHEGCVIEEHFHAEGPGQPWAGHSVSTLVGDAWRQTWVDDQGSYLAFTGAWNGREMILGGEPQTKDTKAFRMRMVFGSITARSIAWRWERTDDGGATWAAKMLIDYRRR